MLLATLWPISVQPVPPYCVPSGRWLPCSWRTPRKRPKVVGTAGMVADTFVQVGQAVTTMAALLDPDAVTSSVKAMAQAAKDAGATLVAITAFARSPWAAMADISLVAGMGT